MIYLFAILTLLTLIAGRVLHGRGGEKWYQTKWVLFTPALIVSGVLPALAAILLFFSGATADNALAYMYRQKNSSRWNIAIGYSWRVGVFVAALLALCFLKGTFLAAWLIPLMIAPIWLVTWTASDNRHVTGDHERDGKHRLNVELSEGLLAGVNAASVFIAGVM